MQNLQKRKLDALMKRVIEGDNDAFCLLYEATAKGIFAFAYSYLGKREDAEDVTQETFFAAKRKAHLYRPGTDVRAWLFQIAKNLSLDELRKKKNSAAPLGDALENTLSVKPQLTELDALTACLDEAEREIVLLHAVWQYKHREIAELTGTPLGTVTWKYKKALAKLRDYLKEDL